jgi:hypothetical protein
MNLGEGLHIASDADDLDAIRSELADAFPRTF